MRILKRLIGFLLLLVLLAVGAAFLLPAHSHLERSTVIARPASQVYALINNYQSFNEWSPWAAKDPKARYTYSGPASGVGAKLAWTGDPNTVGSGSQEITESTPGKSITTALDFGDHGKATAHFLLAPEGQGTKVTWTLDGDAPISIDSKFLNGVIGRYVYLFIDKMVGPDYESGLSKLKALVETFPNVDIAGIEPKVVELVPRKILFVSASSGIDAEGMRSALAAAFGSINGYMTTNNLTYAGAPLTLTTSWDDKAWAFDAAIPAEYGALGGDEVVKAGMTSAGKAVQWTHTGPYSQLGEPIGKLYAWIAVQGMKPRDRLMAEYINDPGQVQPEQLQTQLTIPVQ
jgi:effector-binding domain-containing protein